MNILELEWKPRDEKHWWDMATIPLGSGLYIYIETPTDDSIRGGHFKLFAIGVKRTISLPGQYIEIEYPVDALGAQIAVNHYLEKYLPNETHK